MENRQEIDERRIERAIIAIHDLGTRPGATRAKVMMQLKKEGFTSAEIKEAAERMANR